MLKKVLLFSLLLSLAHCGSIQVARIGTIDKGDKSITMPAGGDMLLMKIKKGLYEDGWRIENFDGAVVTEKTKKKEIKFQTYNTRYILALDYEMMDNYVLSYFSGSLIDKKTRGEVLLFSSENQISPAKAAELVLLEFKK